MNNKYIKRQLTLHNLGLPMNKDIQDYYNYFHLLININNLEKLTYENYPDSVFWQKGGEVRLEYNTKKEYFVVDYYTIWKKFEIKYGLKDNDISELIGAMLEEYFNLKVTISDFSSSRFIGTTWGNLI